MSHPSFHAWSIEAARVDAFTATLSALMHTEGHCDVEISTPDGANFVKRDGLSAAKAIELVRATFTTKSRVMVWAKACGAAGELFSIRLECHGENYAARFRPDVVLGGDIPWWARVDDPFLLDVVFLGGQRSRLGEAALFARRQQAISEHALLRICAPDESKRVTTGCISTGRWYAPLEAAGTYNFDGSVARDVALSWLYIHEGDRVEHVAGLPMDALAARIDAAPRGTCIGVATNVKQLGEHVRRDIEATSTKLGWPPHPGAVRRGARTILPTDAELTREQVLAVLETPPATLVDALEAAAVPDADWRDAEALALKMVEVETQGAPTVEVPWPDGSHVHFIQHHAPYHVRRLPNGGVLLATHPYRTLWQLWADALLLLGIRS